MTLTLAILAAGRSTRFGRLKQLAPVGPGGEALLDYALYDAALAGFDRFVLVIQEALRDDFDAHLRRARGAGLEIGYLYQRLEATGVGAAPSEERVRPWGTGHAALVAAAAIDGPLALCNADDFYGREAYRMLARTMRGWGDGVEGAKVEAATVGYRLATTLSSRGGVSRGILEVSEEGALQRLTEGLELRREGAIVRGRDVAGRTVLVDPESSVCTNLWGFRRGIASLLGERFAAFLARGPKPDDEFHLPEAVNALVAAGRVRCTVLPARARWLGVTFAGDRAGVAQSLRRLVESGVLPMRIWDAFPPSQPPRSD